MVYVVMYIHTYIATYGTAHKQVYKKTRAIMRVPRHIPNMSGYTGEWLYSRVTSSVAARE